MPPLPLSRSVGIKRLLFAWLSAASHSRNGPTIRLSPRGCAEENPGVTPARARAGRLLFSPYRHQLSHARAREGWSWGAMSRLSRDKASRAGCAMGAWRWVSDTPAATPEAETYRSAPRMRPR